MPGGPWTDTENDLIVADYFAMLVDDIYGRAYDKSGHRRALIPRLNGRSEGAVEYKHQNISAVLLAFGQPLIAGYKPAFNYQASLEDAVERWLETNTDWLRESLSTQAPNVMEEPGRLWIGPAPTLSNQPPPKDLEQRLRSARKFDTAGRDERNRALGDAGERLVVERERAVLRDAGRDDLAGRVCWSSKELGDGAGYDVNSFEADGRARLIEVKTTNGEERTPFHITRNELAVADERRSEWVLLRLWNFCREPKAFELRPPLDAHVTLTPTTFQGSFH